jgi:hypothetical protein
MNRRGFLSLTGAAVGGSISAAHPLLRGPASPPTQAEPTSRPTQRDLRRHRFGVNYTPSRNWWFCWNDWQPDSIQRDLDGITALGADHLRILLIWPYFQPNPRWVSPLLLDRLDQLLTWMAARRLDAVVTVFTGQLSGWFFLPPFNKRGAAFYTDPGIWSAQELFVRELAGRMQPHSNFLGFDIGNEINTCWSCDPAQGDAWMGRMFALMNEAAPGGLHVNGVDEVPWMEVTTFSPQALASRPMPTMHCYPYWSGALKYGGPMDPPSTRILAAMAALIRSYAGDPSKPIWAEEFNTCIESFDQKQQAAWLEAAVLAAIAEGVSWFTYWDSHDVDRRFAFNSVEYSLGLMTNDGRVKEQGRVFQQLAAAYRGKEVAFPAKPIPPPPPVRTMSNSWKWMLDWLGWKPPHA